MILRLEVGYRPGLPDAQAVEIRRRIREYLKIPVKEVRIRRQYFLEAELEAAELERAGSDLFRDPVSEVLAVDGSLAGAEFDWSILVCFRPGVTDNVGRTARSALEELLGRPLGEGSAIHTGLQYLLLGVGREEAERIASELLANDLIETWILQDRAEIEREGPALPSFRVGDSHPPQVVEIDLEVPEAELEKISRERTLALSREEMKAIRDYFRRQEVRTERRQMGLGESPTDVELEALAQTWSEHCHHKVFNGIIRYDDGSGRVETIDSLFRTYIRGVTEELEAPWLLSVFTDNAGVVRFNERLSLAYKVETHNSPSALDPYGGAMTGIVGVNRDPLGTGLGSRLIANVWGYCLGDPFHTGPLPNGLQHPRRLRDGIHRGVIEGGNQSGIPYARGWELFEERFMGKPLVFCGTLGEMPPEIRGVPSHRKEVRPGDIIVMVGGRVGKDGIHGATFSSEELHSGSPVQAVQIGDPITQKRMTDMLLEARDRLLYRALTDNGAGGLSSSLGEMARLSGGCEIDLAQVPLKYQGLDPWEILVSEAQERMSLAIPPEKLEEYLALSRRRGVESTPLGRFTSSGRFHVRCGERTVALLDLEFLHRGDPPYELEARFALLVREEPRVGELDHNRVLKEMLGRLNLCSPEDKARQYDHEVQGRSVIKPFAGRDFDVPTEATVLLAEYGGEEGILLTEAVNPFFSDIDAYWMAASVVDLAVRRTVAAGGDLAFMAGLDNFCWPNVVKEGMPERGHKLAQLVRANQGLYDFCLSYGVPLISGKDSMSNDCTLTDPPISVPPTLLFSVLGRVKQVHRCLTPDAKAPGDLVYVLGETGDELGGSEFYRYYGELEQGKAFVGSKVPRVDALKSLRMYRAVQAAAEAGLLRSCAAPAMGGLIITLARTAFGGMEGLEIDLRKVPWAKAAGGKPAGGAPADHILLYSESNGRLVATVDPAKRQAFERLMKGQACALVGRVGDDGRLRITGLSGKLIVDERLDELKEAWKRPLREL